MKKVEEYIKKHHNHYIKKISKHALEVKFDEKFDNPNIKDINIFIIKPKQAYYNNDYAYCPYIDYFIDYFDPDGELLLAYLRIKAMTDRDKEYKPEVFFNDIQTFILSDYICEQIVKMVEYNYSLKLSPKNTLKFQAIEFNDEHGKILLQISMAIKIIIPLVTHYIFKKGIKDTDEFLAKTFNLIIPAFQGNVNMKNKLYEFISSKMNKTKTSDAGHWHKVEIFGNDPDSETETILSKMIVDIIYKFNFDENIVALLAISSKKNIYWATKSNFARNLKPISEVQDSDGLSDLDKVEMNNSKFDESFTIMGEINVKQTIKKLKKKYKVEFTVGELDYYIKHLSTNKFQRKLIFNLFGEYFGNINDEYNISRKQFAKLVIILKRMLEMHGCRIIQYILIGDMTINPHAKKLPKKKINYILNSDIYKRIKKEKYGPTADLILNREQYKFDDLNIILSSTVKLVDYENKDKTGKRINIDGNVDVIIVDYLKLIEMI